MAINKSFAMKFTPRGLVDAFDSTDKFPGACRRMTDLIFDQANPELVKARPGVVTIVDLNANGFPSATFISIQETIGSRIFGLCATSTNTGHDEPFIYDLATGAFVTISGVTSANTPVSPSLVNDWVPPTMASVGVYVLVTHPGFPGTSSHFFGVFDLTNPAAPVWSSVNTTTNGLTAVPAAVANFNNRAYFAVGNQVQYTDELSLTRTNASQALTIGDTTVVNALAGLPLQTTSSGVVQSLTVFKQTQVWQVTGDEALANLALNYVSLNIGTTFPRTVVQSTFGVYFLSVGGPYFIDLFGNLHLLTHSMQENEPDLQVPFQNAVTPTRWSGAYAGSVYRVCGPTIILGVQGSNDYWFDEHKRRWTGPHSFPYDCASTPGNFFVLSSVNNPGLLLHSDFNPNSASVYTDITTPKTCLLQSSTFPKVSDMFMRQVAESQIELAAQHANIMYDIMAQDEQGHDIGDATITAQGSGILWGGGAKWGDGSKWGLSAPVPHTYPVPWPAPLVFEKMQLQITVPMSEDVGIGTFFARYQQTGYMTLG